jgi:hypothetical protein
VPCAADHRILIAKDIVTELVRPGTRRATPTSGPDELFVFPNKEL